ncbi:hypothetical protein [Bradyrhizobium sp. LMTR 3]|uniref:hypothetical protein n=1 Tax=Bradyrhizobium sp. LMTR 3 TaxID=189873 RepID=UPI000810E528|nr:hypothetical protein [Bradyrhizobium sp. LMTR 3]OCK59674.1 hypothetical protein LMTR3_18640 [Bradyrhizobium sp. LMTR 3]
MDGATAGPRKGWKDHLLKSGVPLEYEVAALMSSADMAVDADFCFLRRDVAGVKEWSVDIAANWYGPTENDVAFGLYALVECKYRSPEKTLLLFEEPNEDFSTATLGGTVASFDALAPFELPANAFVEMERRLDFVYKGIEIFGNGAVEEDIRHGIQQLRYAAPARLRQVFDIVLSSHPDDRLAIFFVKILVTNAPLRLVNRDVKIETIRSASTLDDISAPIDTAILFSDYGPDFEDHVRSIFESGAEDRIKAAESIKRQLAAVGKKFKFYSDPMRLAQDFAQGGGRVCRHMGTQFFITTLHALPNLLASIKNASAEAYDSRTKLKRQRKTTKSR